MIDLEQRVTETLYAWARVEHDVDAPPPVAALERRVDGLRRRRAALVASGAALAAALLVGVLVVGTSHRSSTGLAAGDSTSPNPPSETTIGAGGLTATTIDPSTVGSPRVAIFPPNSSWQVSAVDVSGSIVSGVRPTTLISYERDATRISLTTEWSDQTRLDRIFGTDLQYRQIDGHRIATYHLCPTCDGEFVSFVSWMPEPGAFVTLAGRGTLDDLIPLVGDVFVVPASEAPPA